MLLIVQLVITQMTHHANHAQPIVMLAKITQHVLLVLMELFYKDLFANLIAMMDFMLIVVFVHLVKKDVLHVLVGLNVQLVLMDSL